MKDQWQVSRSTGTHFLVLRYGNRILRLAEHGNAVEVGDWANMVPVLDTLIVATAAGELDQALTPTVQTKQAKTRRARSKRVA